MEKASHSRKKQISLRIPAELHEKFRRIAGRNNRSINGQMLHLMGQWVEDWEEEHMRRYGPPSSRER